MVNGPMLLCVRALQRVLSKEQCEPRPVGIRSFREEAMPRLGVTALKRPRRCSVQEFLAEDQTVSLVYLTSGAGDAAANARWNAARSALGKSETAM
jgi:hypothetical protein